MTLPPLSVTSCAKCDAAPTAIGMQWRAAHDDGGYKSVLWWYRRDADANWNVDVMERRCTICNFTWLEAPRDVRA